MASSGVIANDFRTGYRLQLVWTVNSQNIANNSSNVTATVQLVSTGSGYNIDSSASKSVSLTINGATYSGTCTVGLSGGQTKTLFSQTVDISHNSDGTKTCSFSTSLALNVTLSGVSWGTVSTNGDGTFNTIPRASSISSFPNFTIGSNIPITISRASTSFTHKLHLYVGGTFINEWTGITDSATLTLTTAQQDMIYSAIPNSTAVTMTLYCLTYNGTTQIGDWVYRQATATVDTTTIVPSFTTVSYSEVNSTVSSLIGAYVQGLSSLNLSITGATGVKYSTISSYSITFDGVTYNGSTAVSSTIKNSGVLTITGTITDSRGISVSKNVQITVLPYSVPRITTFTVTRCDSNGTPNDLGRYAKVISAGSVSPLTNGTEKNSLTYKISSKDRDIANYTTNKTSTIVSLSLSATDILSTYDEINSFDFKLEITDRFNTTISLTVLATGQVAMSWSKSGVGIGKVWEQGTLDVGGDIYSSGTKVLLSNASCNKNWNWSGQSGQPTWLWGGNDGTNMYVWNPSNFSVANAGYSSRLRRYPENDGYWISATWQGNSNGFRIVANNDYSDNQANIHRTSVNVADEVWKAGKNPAFTFDVTTANQFGGSGNGSGIYVNHYLGYYPIVMFSGTTGNIEIMFRHESVNQTFCYAWSSGGNTFTGTIYFY